MAAKHCARWPRSDEGSDDGGEDATHSLLPVDTSGHDNKTAAIPKRGEKRSLPPRQGEERPEKRAAGSDADTVAAKSPKRKKKKSKRKAEKDRLRKKRKKQLTKRRARDEEEQQEKMIAEEERAGDTYVITLSSSDDGPRLTSGAADVITLTSSSDDEKGASSGKESAGSKIGPVVMTSSDYDSDGPLLAKSRERRPPSKVPWLFCDEVCILTALAKDRQLLRSPSGLLDVISTHLERRNPTACDVGKKVYNLKNKFKELIASHGPSRDLRDRKFYDLSMKVWPELLPSSSSS